jgi:hypothetical protein
VLTRSIVAGYLCFLPFVPSFLVTLVSSLLLIHLPPRAHTYRTATSRSPIPVPWCGRSKKQKQKIAIFYTLSTLLVVFSFSLVANNICFVFSTIIQLCIIV